jgi:hypothetical protein
MGWVASFVTHLGVWAPGSEKQRERLTIGLPAPAGPILGQKAQLTGAGNNPTVYRARENRDCVDTSRYN